MLHECSIFVCREEHTEFVHPQCVRAAKQRASAGADKATQTPDVVIVPVRGEHVRDTPRRIEAQTPQVGERHWLALGAGDARIDDDPTLLAEVTHEALPVARSEERELELVRPRRCPAQESVQRCLPVALL
jgi:hypothetical protein